MWLSQKNIVNFEWGNITQYLIFEGLDVLGQATLLVEAMVSSLAQPSNGVWLGVWLCWQLHSFDELSLY
jgi:hypothetical protein